MSEPYTLPVVPLREAVFFPGVTAPLGAGRPGSVRAIEAALSSSERRVFLLAQRENTEEVRIEGLHAVGTVAHIVQSQRGPAGIQLIVHGERRAHVLRVAEQQGYLVATLRDVEVPAVVDPADAGFIALLKEVRERARELGEKLGLPREAVQQFLAESSDPGALADLVAAYVEMPHAERQALLETAGVEERLRAVLVPMQRQIAVLEAQAAIKSKVQQEVGDRQREFFLRQQLKAIQQELGEAGGGEGLEELKERLAALDLPEVARKEVNRELARLERIGGEGQEAQVIRTFLETVAELPWNERSAEILDLGRAEEVLDEDHYALGEVKDRVLEFLAMRALHARRERRDDGAREGERQGSGGEGDASQRSPILLFVGPPGVGKTSVARSIARATGRTYVRVALGGARDEADIRGHRRTYVGAMPGRIIQGMRQAGTKNPVFLLDEVDKLGVSFQGDPASALLEVLDPAQNDTFTDHYLGIPFDLSEVLFIATANYLQNIPAPLLDRMEVVEFSGYTEDEKREIARRFLIPRQQRAAGLEEGQFALEETALATVISRYTREAGVRQLEREIGRLARKVARRVASGGESPACLTAADVEALLGRPKVRPERAAREDQVGIATGMYYTPVGGDIMFVEVSTMPGKGELVLTGQLGDVMKESARAAWSFARAHAGALHIEPEAFTRDVHVHVPAGAIPKDGPSAGIAMAAALVSALSGRPARHEVAMTGEITLAGRVLPIGGLKEKILGAVRAGITEVVIPADNLADLADLPETVRASLVVHAVEELGEALAVVLRGGSFASGRLLFDGQRPEDVPPLSSRAH
ncbi:MAG: endopeptidase La [Acidobacteriota bacterium]|jgi:ATP-dependent Lon protease